MFQRELNEAAKPEQKSETALSFADIVGSPPADFNKENGSDKTSVISSDGKLTMNFDNLYQSTGSDLKTNFQVKDNAVSAQNGESLIAGLPHSDRAKQREYIEENVNRIMTNGTRLDQGLDVGLGTGWSGKAAAVQDYMNDTGWVNFKNDKDRRAYLNNVAGDFNRTWGNALQPAETRGLSDRPAGYPKAYVDKENRVQVILVTEPGGNTPVQYNRLGQ
ncbi:MAG: hypothetical protein HY986_13430 [Candidatus Melainabacteria bacterium]|nr:hypothetical protein [Candidatus Melainabacteria bacterium]